MSHRYALRFESGERLGETVPLDVQAVGAAFTIGRKPGNSLQVVDTSVSGRHAELEVAADGVTVRDLDSTNGTRVGGERVRTATLRHGDELALGNVLFTVLDVESAAPVSGPALPGLKTGALPAPGGGDLARTQVQPREERLEITAEDLARSRRGSKLAPLVLGALALGGGAAFWWTSQQDDGGAGGRAAARPVTPPAGNLLAAGYSFEGDGGWAADEVAPVAFASTRGARASGQRGLSAVLEPGEHALHVSVVSRVRAGEGLEAQASFRTSGTARARLALRFERASAQLDGTTATPLTVWSDPIVSDGAHEIFAFTATAPAGYDRVSLFLRAEAPEDGDGSEGGEVEVDDAVLVPADGVAPLAVAQWEALAVGAPPRAVTLSKVDRVLVSGLTVERTGRHDQATLDVTLDAGALWIGASDAGRLTLVAEPALVAHGLATLGDGGYGAHGANFEREDVTDLLLGADADLVRVVLPRPSTVRAVATGDGARLRVDLAAGDAVRVQLRFDDERSESQRIARRARAARAEARPGDALAAWDELLEQYPFEQRLVDEAASARGELVRDGLVALRELAGELERARFFRLVDLYDELGGRVAALGARYAGSEVEVEALALAATLGAERAALATDLDRYERQRLDAIARYLGALGATRLAGEVRGYRDENFTTSDGPGGDR